MPSQFPDALSYSEQQQQDSSLNDYFHLLACKSAAAIIKQQSSLFPDGDDSAVCIESQALDLLGQLLALCMGNFCLTAKKWASSARRTQLNAIDVGSAMKMRGSSPSLLMNYLVAAAVKKRQSLKSAITQHAAATSECSTECSSQSSSSNFQSLSQSTQCSSQCPSSVGIPRSIKLETSYRPKHFYDFLPALPSVHCYKRTPHKYISSTDKAFIAYRKAEERRIMERNLNRLWQQSGWYSSKIPSLCGGRLNYDDE